MPNLTDGSDVVSVEDESVFEKAFAAYSVVIIGSRESDGTYDLAPKHMVTPVGWSDYFGFTCSPDHSTTDNVLRNEEFTVSYPNPDQIVSVSLSAEPRDETDRKPDIDELNTVDAPNVDAQFIDGAYIYIECELEQIVRNLGNNNFIIGNITGQYVKEEVLRRPDRDDAEIINDHPLLTYLHPGRYAEINDSRAFPFPRGFQK